MPGPTELIRQNCPPVVASSGGVGGNDGYLTAQQYEALLNGGGVSISDGVGLVCTPNPIVGTGSIGIDMTGAGNAYYLRSNTDGTDVLWDNTFYGFTDVGNWYLGTNLQPGVDPTNSNYFLYVPSDPDTTPWYQWTGSFSNGVGVRRNQVLRAGWNLSSGGGRVSTDTYDGALGDEWEQYYEFGGAKFMERHHVYVDPANTISRYISFDGRLEAPYTTRLWMQSNLITIGRGTTPNDNDASIVINATETQLRSPNSFDRIRAEDTNIQMEAGTTSTPATKFIASSNGDAYMQGTRGFLGTLSNFRMTWTATSGNIQSPDTTAEVFVSNSGVQLIAGSDLALWLTGSVARYRHTLDSNTDKAINVGAASRRFGYGAFCLDAGSLPAASSSLEGAMTIVPGAAGVGSTLRAVMKGTDDNYTWVTLFTAP